MPLNSCIYFHLLNNRFMLLTLRMGTVFKHHYKSFAIKRNWKIKWWTETINQRIQFEKHLYLKTIKSKGWIVLPSVTIVGHCGGPLSSVKRFHNRPDKRNRFVCLPVNERILEYYEKNIAKSNTWYSDPMGYSNLPTN